MSQLISTDYKRLIVGLGMTGLSAARYCQRRGWSFDLCDSRDVPPGLDTVRTEFPQANIFTGELQADILSRYDELIVSPGMAVSHPAIAAARQAGARIAGDIQLFADVCDKPLIAITGSNGKSTVTTLTGELLAAAGKRVAVGGNIGVPALDLLIGGAETDIYVLELSSFQLETTENLAASAAVVLNMSEDHMDRYQGMADYHQAKHRIFQQCRAIVVNRDDALSQPLVSDKMPRLSFGLNKADIGQFGLERIAGESWITFGAEKIIAASELKIKGQHNLANVMAALALIKSVGVDIAAVLPALRHFSGLEYRCQWLGNLGGVDFYNDSKGTNVGSTLAAIYGLGPEICGKIWLLAGGEGKGQDFSPLASACKQYAAEVLTYGADAALIQSAVSAACTTSQQSTLAEAFGRACSQAQSGDVILLSPACASFDQFKNYAARGEYFSALVAATINKEAML
ncbi:MAG: UDP-N-acetylmuramoyl-L-alanine--D-glutamate ligase [Saccharospirillaceae bacterium]|nr:UDP-N-acetylmuramoyl-L-alanine--D-glutamate ligase [Saccharospirillaceae bacterium]MCD8530045.1 UDP-N-acetylmuramoyl-L-alanine--D-glutamate ligase [Saccharospirillaceae bacterium]